MKVHLRNLENQVKCSTLKLRMDNLMNLFLLTLLSRVPKQRFAAGALCDKETEQFADGSRKQVVNYVDD